MIKKSALVAATLVLAAAGAQASGVYWSIGINAPIQPGVSIGTVFSNAPVYQAAPAYYPPAPVVYAEPAYHPSAPAVYVEPVYYPPAPVFVRQAPVVYLPQLYYTPRRAVYATGWAPSRHGYRHDRGHWGDEHRQRGEPVMARYGDR